MSHILQNSLSLEVSLCDVCLGSEAEMNWHGKELNRECGNTTHNYVEYIKSLVFHIKRPILLI